MGSLVEDLGSRLIIDSGSVGGSLRSSVGGSLRSSVGGSVRSSVGGSVRSSVGGSVRSSASSSDTRITRQDLCNKLLILALIACFHLMISRDSLTRFSSTCTYFHH